MVCLKTRGRREHSKRFKLEYRLSDTALVRIKVQTTNKMDIAKQLLYRHLLCTSSEHLGHRIRCVRSTRFSDTHNSQHSIVITARLVILEIPYDVLEAANTIIR